MSHIVFCTSIIYVSEILQLIEIIGIFWGLSPCLALGIMEWWNIGMLVLKEVFHLLIPLSRGVLPINNCPVFPPSPCDLVLLHPSFHYSIIPIGAEPLSS